MMFLSKVHSLGIGTLLVCLLLQIYMKLKLCMHRPRLTLIQLLCLNSPNAYLFYEKSNILRLHRKLVPVLDRDYALSRFTINLIMQMCNATVTLNDDFTSY